MWYPALLLIHTPRDDRSEDEDDGSSRMAAVVPEGMERTLAPGGRRSIERTQSVRAGLFDKRNQMKLKEGQWRTIKHRVTKARALRSLMEMNRKFHIETPLDTEVLDYSEHVTDDGEAEEDAAPPSVMEPSPRKFAFLQFSASAKRQEVQPDDEESPCVTPEAPVQPPGLGIAISPPGSKTAWDRPGAFSPLPSPGAVLMKMSSPRHRHPALSPQECFAGFHTPKRPDSPLRGYSSPRSQCKPRASIYTVRDTPSTANNQPSTHRRSNSNTSEGLFQVVGHSFSFDNSDSDNGVSEKNLSLRSTFTME